MNKVLYSSLALAASLTIAAACGGKSGGDGPATGGTAPTPAPTGGAGSLLTGKAAFGDYSTDAPGTRRRITPADLPPPYATPHVDNGPQWMARPDGVLPQVPAGFTANMFAGNLENPRKMITAPNGDIFVVLSNPGQIQVLRDADGDGKAETNQTFVSGLNKPFGVAFYPNGANPQWLYVGNTDGVVRIPYKTGNLAATGQPEVVTDQISGGGKLRGGGHWTRDVAFSSDGKRMFVSVGSLTNVNQENNPVEEERARIWEFTPDGKDRRAYATGIRNPVGLAVDSRTGALWTSVNERDGLGDDLVPDYITKVKDGGFYGWPWYYIGSNEDPRKAGEKPELKGKVTVPDVLLQPHYASLALTFYNGKSFPKEYQGGVFAAEHGSWNRAKRTGYKVIFVPVDGSGNAKGEFQDFAVGMVGTDKNVWGRPVGVTVANDGSLLFSDDASGTVWRVAYTGKKK